MQFSFRKPHFWQPKILQKHYFDTLWHYLCYKKKPKNHYKTGEQTAKKNLDQFLTYNLDQFLTYKTPNLGPVFNSTAYIYMPACSLAGVYFIGFVIFGCFLYFGCFGGLGGTQRKREREREKERERERRQRKKK